MKKYNYAVTLAFEVASDQEEQPLLHEILHGLARRIAMLHNAPDPVASWKEATNDVYDCEDFDSETRFQRWLKAIDIPKNILDALQVKSLPL